MFIRFVRMCLGNKIVQKTYLKLDKVVEEYKIDSTTHKL